MSDAAVSAPRRGRAPAGASRSRLTDRAKAERKLGWMLCAPAAIVMLAVTAYPILYAVYLSLQRADLRFPDDNEWVGLDNYITVLSSSLWWKDVCHTLLITVVSVAIELVLGMLLALVMHRAIFGRGLVRTAGADPVRHRDRRRRVRVAVCLVERRGRLRPEGAGLDFDPPTSRTRSGTTWW